MHITINNRQRETSSPHLMDLFRIYGKEADDVILNGFSVSRAEMLGSDILLQETDELFFIPRGRMPRQDELEAMMASRHTPGIHEKVKKARAAVAGLGGLGSHIAVMLARTGVGSLLLVDYDTVEPSNLNRQNYMISHLGKKKTEALSEQIRQINPFIKVETRDVRITGQNAVEIFDGWDVVCEALDRPEEKAVLVNQLLAKLPGTYVVCASGMAGCDSANLIGTVRRMKRLYVCGDSKSGAEPGMGLMAPRVQICAGHQANMALRLILGLESA